MFKDFSKKLQRDVKKMVDIRLKASEELSGGRLKVILFIYEASNLLRCIPYKYKFTSVSSVLVTCEVTCT